MQNDSLERLLEEWSDDNGYSSYEDALFETMQSYLHLEGSQDVLEPFKGVKGIEILSTNSFYVMFVTTGCGIVLMGTVQFSKYDDRTDVNAIVSSLFTDLVYNIMQLQDEDGFDEFLESYTGEYYE